MIVIKKGEHTLKVSKESYKSMFERMGYIIVNEKEEAQQNASSENNIIPENKDSENSSENQKIDILSNEIDNLSEDDKKEDKNDSEQKEEDDKEDIEDTNKDEEDKEKNLEDILGMLSKKETERNNRQAKSNKEEK